MEAISARSACQPDGKLWRASAATILATVANMVRDTIALWRGRLKRELYMTQAEMFGGEGATAIAGKWLEVCVPAARALVHG